MEPHVHSAVYRGGVHALADVDSRLQSAGAGGGVGATCMSMSPMYPPPPPPRPHDIYVSTLNIVTVNPPIVIRINCRCFENKKLKKRRKKIRTTVASELSVGYTSFFTTKCDSKKKQNRNRT